MTEGNMDISADEWQLVNNLISGLENPQEDVKFLKEKYDENGVLHPGRIAGLKHSFVVINGRAFATANAEYLGEGAFGKVKIAQDEAGNTYAIKVEGVFSDQTEAEKTAKKQETEILSELGYLIAHFERKVNATTTWKDSKGNLKTSRVLVGKKYSVQNLIEGSELKKSLYVKNNQLNSNVTDAQKLLIALRACMQIQSVHDKGILHGDIKPENFMATMDGLHILVSPVDFGFALKLNGKEKIDTLKDSFGTPKRKAPEIESENPVYSRASDVYALGKMLRDDLRLPLHVKNIEDLMKNIDTDVILRMFAAEPQQRPTLGEVINHLKETLLIKLEADISEIKNRDPAKLDADTLDKLAQMMALTEELQNMKPFVSPPPSIELTEIANQIAEMNEPKSPKAPVAEAKKSKFTQSSVFSKPQSDNVGKSKINNQVNSMVQIYEKKIQQQFATNHFPSQKIPTLKDHMS